MGDARTVPPSDWPFEDPPNTACITCKDVVWRGVPVGLVTHDDDDGGFQFLPLSGAPSDAREACVVGLGQMLQRDPTLAEVADLPFGWRAWREAPGQPWTREPQPPED
jgi:hypothetical protein